MDRTTTRQTRQTRPGRTQLAFHASRIIIDLGVMIAMAAMSMPFVTAEGADRSSVQADALPVILLLAPIFLITLIPDHTRPIPKPLGWFSLILGIAALPYSIVKYIDATTVAETIGGTVAMGARLLVFGTFVTLLGIGVGLTRNLLRLPQGGTYPARPRPPESGPRRRAAAGRSMRTTRPAKPPVPADGSGGGGRPPRSRPAGGSPSDGVR